MKIQLTPFTIAALDRAVITKSRVVQQSATSRPVLQVLCCMDNKLYVMGCPLSWCTTVEDIPEVDNQLVRIVHRLALTHGIRHSELIPLDRTNNNSLHTW